MKKLKPFIVFALLFLLGIELFIFFDISTDFLVVIPSSLAFASISALAIHLYRMVFDKEYQWKKISHKRRHHKGGHHHRSHSTSRIQVQG